MQENFSLNPLHSEVFHEVLDSGMSLYLEKHKDIQSQRLNPNPPSKGTGFSLRWLRNLTKQNLKKSCFLKEIMV